LKLVVNNIRLPIEEDSPVARLAAVSRKLKCAVADLSITKILSRNVELRDKEQFYYLFSLVVTVPDDYPNRRNFSLYRAAEAEPRAVYQSRERPIIVGFGPAGMFAALELIDQGAKPIIVERGKKIEERSLDVERFIKERKLNPESNIQFGEGGAGSYSDGKLFSRRNNNTSTVNRVLQRFVQFGAPAEIEYISKPHLGTDVLCEIVKNIRLHVLEHGGEIHYGARMTDLLITDKRAVGIVVNGEQEFLSSDIYLALGHSARDTLTLLKRRGVALEQRQIAVGVRIEHPAAVINLMRYGKKYVEYPGLGAATYSLNHTNRAIRRGVYTFCMCPGGEVVNASSEEGLLVLNGMSYSERSSPFSNGALVVSCHRSDYGSDDALAGISFQRELEKKAFAAGGGNWSVPAQNLMHFLGEESAGELCEVSCRLGVVAAEMRDILPGFVTDELRVAFHKWRSEVPLFISRNAILMGVETRTSSPVRILRNENFESVNIKNLYPIGEGAGYTGGITSSAADAIKAVAAHGFRARISGIKRS